MKKNLLKLILLLPIMFIGSAIHSQLNTIYDQLVYVNPEWKNQHDINSKLKTIAAKNLNEQQLIQQHLNETEKLLRKRNINKLTPSLQQHRLQNLSVLHTYCAAGSFPVNTLHLNRQPYFIDDNNTYCAVGYLMKESGSDEVAKDIKRTQNYSYLKDIHHPKLMSWVRQSGLSFDELALIQPGYPNDRPATILEFHYNNTGTDVGEYIEFQQPVRIAAPVNRLLFYNTAGVLYKTLMVSAMQLLPGDVYSYSFPSNENFADNGKVEMHSVSNINEIIIYDTDSVITITLSDFGQYITRKYMAAENESTSVGTSLTFCGRSFGFGNTFLTLQSMSPTPGTVNPCVLLPIVLSNFNYIINQNKVNLVWETVSESNTQHFEVERSLNGVDFTSIGMVLASGNSTTSKQYSFTDTKPDYINHYRLKQTDKDGKYSYSKILFVKVAGVSPLSIFQTVVTKQLNYVVNSANEAKLVIYDLTGRQMLSTSTKMGAASINVSGWGAGKYIVRLFANGQVYSEQFMKQ